MTLIVLINIVGWGSGFGWLATCVLRAREADAAAFGDTTTARRVTTIRGGMAGTSRQGVDSAALPAPLPLDRAAMSVEGRGVTPGTRKRPAMTGGPITELNRSVYR